MPLSLRAVGSAVGQVGSHFLLSLAANVVAMVLSLPLLVVVSLLAIATHSIAILPAGVVLLVGILPNPAAAGLQVVMRDLATHSFPNARTQLQGLRAYWREALKLWGVSCAITLVIVGNIALYGHIALSRGSAVHTVAGPLELLWLCALLLWCAMHLYAYPLLLQQEEGRTFLAYRNAGIMAFVHPVFTFLVLLVWLAVLIISSYSGVVTIIGLALAAAIQQSAFTKLLPLFRRS